MANDSLEKTLSGGSRDIPEEGPVKPVFIEKEEGEDEKELVKKTDGNFGNFQRMFDGELGVGEQAFTLPGVSEEQLEEPITEEDVKRGSRLKEEDGRVEPVGVKDIALNIWEGLGDFGGTEESAIANYLVNTPAADAINKAQSIISDSDVRLTDVFKQGVKRKARNADNSIPEPPEDFQSGSTSSSQQDSFSSPEEQNFGLPEQESGPEDKSTQEATNSEKSTDDAVYPEGTTREELKDIGLSDKEIKEEQAESEEELSSDGQKMTPVPEKNMSELPDEFEGAKVASDPRQKLASEFGGPVDVSNISNEELSKRGFTQKQIKKLRQDQSKVDSIKKETSGKQKDDGFIDNNTITVQEGDTLSSIADRSNYTVDEIMDANPQIDNKDEIYAGNWIFTPDADAVTNNSEKMKTNASNPEQRNTSSKIIPPDDVKQMSKDAKELDIPPPDFRKSLDEKSKDKQREPTNSNVAQHASNVFGFIASMANPEIYQSYVRSAQQDRRLDIREAQQQLAQKEQMLEEEQDLIENKKDFAKQYQSQLQKLNPDERTPERRRKVMVDLFRENRELYNNLKSSNQLESFRRGLQNRNVDEEINKFAIREMNNLAEITSTKLQKAQSDEERRSIWQNANRSVAQILKSTGMRNNQVKKYLSTFSSRVDPRSDDFGSGSGESVSEIQEEKFDRLIKQVNDFDEKSTEQRKKKLLNALDNMNATESDKFVERTNFGSMSSIKNMIKDIDLNTTNRDDTDIRKAQNDIKSDLIGGVRSEIVSKINDGDMSKSTLKEQFGTNNIDDSSEAIVTQHLSSPDVQNAMTKQFQEANNDTQDWLLTKRALHEVESEYIENKIDASTGQDKDVGNELPSTEEGFLDQLGTAGDAAQYVGNTLFGSGDTISESELPERRSTDYEQTKTMIKQSQTYQSPGGSIDNNVSKFINNTLYKNGSNVDITSPVREEIFREQLVNVIKNSTTGTIKESEIINRSKSIVRKLEGKRNLSLKDVKEIVDQELVF